MGENMSAYPTFLLLTQHQGVALQKTGRGLKN